jgi:hypothetical protein
LVDLSILSRIQGSLSMGFVVGPTGASGSEPLLIRAVGPSIGPGSVFNVPGILPDPTLKVVQQSSGSIMATDAGWGTPSSNATAVLAADAATGAFPLTNTGSLDSALVTSLPQVGGGYAAIVSGKSGDSGYALTEVYDDTPSASYVPGTSPRLVNLSCLTQLAAGATLDSGFVVGGTGAMTLLIRATGPAIGPGTTFNVAGVVPDPELVIQSGNGSTTYATNAGWGGNSQVTAADTATGAFALTNTASNDSAVVVTLPPGTYSAQVSSVSGAAGAVLLEIYEVP